MGRYKAERTIIKLFPDLTIVFYDHKSIYVYPSGDQRGYIFHSWHAPLFNYRDNWLPFKKALLKRRYLDSETCWSLAYDYGVPYKTASSRPEIKGKPVELRYKRWSIKGVL